MQCLNLSGVLDGIGFYTKKHALFSGRNVDLTQRLGTAACTGNTVTITTSLPPSLPVLKKNVRASYSEKLDQIR